MIYDIKLVRKSHDITKFSLLLAYRAMHVTRM